MADISEIRERLDNLGVIDHLIRSMRAMSAIRWRKARSSLLTAQRYAAHVQEQLSLAVSYPTSLVRGAYAGRRGPPLEQGSGEQSPTGRSPRQAPSRLALIVIASDHGLCGSFNTVLFHTADVYIDRWRKQNASVDLIALGEYARRYYCTKTDVCHLVWTHRFPLTHVVSFIETRDIWQKVEDLYQQGNLDELYLIYNHFISFGRYRQRMVRLLPPELTPLSASRGERPILGSKAVELQRFLLFEHLAMQLYLGLVESMVSEQAARLQSMDAAKANIDGRADELKQAYHIARQEGITQEMLEIASGAGYLDTSSSLSF
ncbi:MAG: F0F1 ATP synthase subunit gamma [Anaerolineae bacterium]|nr:F0F1 ATP synthase subunit gamma [Anaerolineae bacterium]